MLKECSESGIVLFAISDGMKFFYYRGLAEYEEHGFLLEMCRAAQGSFRAVLDYFRIDH